jgi:hypothetical protein
MCVAVAVGKIEPTGPRWDRDSVTIIIGPGLDHFTALRQVRAMLAWLGVPQTGMGARCWCGDPVTLPNLAARVPDQAVGPRPMQTPATR